MLDFLCQILYFIRKRITDYSDVEFGLATRKKITKLERVRVHDLKHTFGRRLRGAGISFEDRQDLLGHRSERITTHYSAAELSRLLKAANSVRATNIDRGKAEIVVLRRSMS